MAYGFHLNFGAHAFAPPAQVRRLRPSDCFLALKDGFDDFVSIPTYPAFVGLFYALSGLTIFSLSSVGDALRLVFPLAAGFALVGPFVAIGLYEMSRRRERGLKTTWRGAFAVFRSPALPSIVALGFVLFASFTAWIGAAETLYVRLYGPSPPSDPIGFLYDVMTTPRGRVLIGAGSLIGFCFAALSLSISSVSFPLMLDRNVGLVSAVESSLRLAWANPEAISLWGLIVASALVLGSAPLFFGLSVVLPILGHSTWHFYRRAIERDPAHEFPVDS